MSSSALSLRGVVKTFASGVRALDGLTFDVAPGSFVALLGPSGCGKSTALRIAAGLTAPGEGAVSTPAADAGRVGFVFQEPTLMPWATVDANVRLPLTLAGVAPAAADRAVADALVRVGLADFATAYPRELSGGMRMRASLARALVTAPDLLLMDEPFAALDEITRFRLNNDLQALWRAARCTVVFVTHSVFESVYLAERIVVMTPRPGRVFTEIAIPAAYPRDEAFRTSAEYGALCRTVSAALHDAMGAGA